MKAFAISNGREVFAERRRYSNRTFTWLYLKSGDDFQSLRDPWPCIMPRRAEVIAALDLLAAKSSGDENLAGE